MFDPYEYYVTPEEYAEAERNGISQRRVNDRIRILGWSKKRAITTPTRKFKDRSELVARAKANGISYIQFMTRIFHGWDEERAITTPIRDKAGARESALRMSELNRKYPREFVELALSNGISVRCFHDRVGRGRWDYTLAATMPPSPYNGPNRVKELYGEDYFKNLRKWMFAPGRIKKAKTKRAP
jgi:hypothetical protein